MHQPTQTKKRFRNHNTFLPIMARKCGICRDPGHDRRKCPNHKRGAEIELMDAEERAAKRLRREYNNKMKAPKAGTKVKGRDGSTRHGMVISYSKYHGPKISEHDIDNRNDTLKIYPKRCLWCNTPFSSKVKKCGDHLHPACSTARSCYSWTNALTIVPSCDSCNSSKGGKILEDWVKELPRLGWTEEKIGILVKWAAANSSKLLFQKDDIEHIEKQFIIINKCHEEFEDCARTKTDISKRINFDRAALLTRIATLEAENAALKAVRAST